ncbi:MAG: HprK-related kinase B, partial [Desulfovibrio sp.]|nr:HprK-related kinase B [Desulfovibrio sp.]
MPPTVSGSAPLPRLSEVADRLLRGFSPAASLFLRLAETDVTVASDSPALIDFLSGYFREFSRPPGPTEVAIRFRTAPPVPPDFCPGLVLADRPFDPREKTSKEQWANLPDGRVVRKKRTGMVFVFGDDLHLAAGPCLEHVDQVVNFINFRVAARHLSGGCLLAHA